VGRGRRPWPGEARSRSVGSGCRAQPGRGRLCASGAAGPRRERADAIGEASRGQSLAHAACFGATDFGCDRHCRCFAVGSATRAVGGSRHGESAICLCHGGFLTRGGSRRPAQ